MAKRKVPADDSDAYDSGNDSDFEISVPKAKRSRTGPKKRVNSGTTAVAGPGTALPQTTACRHSKNKHILVQPAPVDALLRWYSGVHTSRGMPWRKTFDPNLGPAERSQRAYEVWVSEVMLQQTQVATVIPYYNTWMREFPSIKALALASLEKVNSVWKGLGYYSRASRLLAGAQKVVEQYGGLLPDNAEEMEANIPGIGRYSAGAICSIAYGERVPVLDGNVHRLLSRLLALHAPPKSKATLDLLWKAASAMVEVAPSISETNGQPSILPLDPILQAKHPGDINQALIELGSTVCKVRDPLCGSCPLRATCLAYANEEKSLSGGVPSGDIEDLCDLCVPIPDPAKVTSYPMKVEKKKSREEVDIVSVLEWRPSLKSKDRQFLLIKRPAKGLLAGLLEFPTLENVSPGTSPSDMVQLSVEQICRLTSQILVPPTMPQQNLDQPRSETDLRIASIVQAEDVEHVFSHIRKTYRVQWIVLTGGGQEPPSVDSSSEIDASKARKNSRNGQASRAKPDLQVAPARNWFHLDAVSETNITTGVLKIWQSAQVLWQP